MSVEFTWSNWINFGLLCMTALVGLLSWLGSRKSAKEARADQEEANAAARRSAIAAEEATKLQARIVQLEEARQSQSEIDARRARLHAERTSKDVFRFNRPEKDSYLTIFNSGQSSASRLEVFVNQKPLNEYQEFHPKLPERASIGSNGRLDLLMMFFVGGALQLPFEVRLAWDDSSGSRGEWAGTIS